MKCDQAQAMIGTLWDLPDDSPEKIQVEKHLAECPVCSVHYKSWDENNDLIKHADIPLDYAADASISGRVMERIYDKESWMRSVSERIYDFSLKTRRNLMVFISAFMAMFLFGLLYPILHNRPVPKPMIQASDLIGVQPLASATVHSASGTNSLPDGVASLSDLPMLQMGPIHAFPQYLVALSLIGLISTLAIMNWIFRTRS